MTLVETKRMRRAAGFRGLVAAAFLATAGCQSVPPPKPEPNLSFLGKPALTWPVGSVEFIDAYRPSPQSSTIEQQNEFKPSHIVRTWMNERFRPDQTRKGRLKITVVDAFVKEEALPVPQGTTLKREPARKLIGRLAWTLVYENAEMTWKTDAFAESERTIPEQPSLNEVDAAYVSLIEGLAKSLDARLETQLQGLNQAIAERQAQPR